MSERGRAARKDCRTAGRPRPAPRRRPSPQPAAARRPPTRRQIAPRSLTGHYVPDRRRVRGDRLGLVVVEPGDVGGRHAHGAGIVACAGADAMWAEAVYHVLPCCARPQREHPQCGRGRRRPELAHALRPRPGRRARAERTRVAGVWLRGDGRDQRRPHDGHRQVQLPLQRRHRLSAFGKQRGAEQAGMGECRWASAVGQAAAPEPWLRLVAPQSPKHPRHPGARAPSTRGACQCTGVSNLPVADTGGPKH